MHGLTLLVLLLVTLAYLFIGAAVFQQLESDNEQTTKTDSRKIFQDFLENATCVDSTDLERLIRDVIEAYDQGVLATNQTESVDNWDLFSSLFFSATVVTTIGYGHISPSTTGGRIFCIFYALLGIPIVAVFLAGIGEKIVIPIKSLKERIDSTRRRKLISIVISVLGFAVIVFIPSIGFHKVEGWSMFESIYYCVITLTTVGFGDFVPGITDDSNNRITRQLLTILWIFVGLAWFAAGITDFTDSISNKIKKRQEKKDKDAANNRNENRIPNKDAQFSAL